MNSTLVFCGVVYWVLCGLFAAGVADRKRAGFAGFFLGMLFGPLGLVAAGFLDMRPNCPRCGGRVNGTRAKPHPICQHCGTELIWRKGKERIRGDIDDAATLRQADRARASRDGWLVTRKEPRPEPANAAVLREPCGSAASTAVNS